MVWHLRPEGACGHDRCARHLRPLVESGTGLERIALAYLSAVKD